MLTTSIALVVAAIAILGYTQLKSKDTISSDMAIIADVISLRSIDALESEDKNSAMEQLQLLKLKPNITLGCIYKSQLNSHQLFSSWSRDTSATPSCPSGLSGFTSPTHFSSIETSIPISRGEKKLGILYLRSDLKFVNDQFFQLLLVISSVLFFVLILAYKISSHLQRFISEPIQHLNQTSLEISRKKDYSLRAEKETNDELGNLVESYNKMLSTIERQNTDLIESKDKLRELILALQESEEHFRAIFEQAADSIVLVNIFDGKFHEYNQIAFQTLGYDREEFSRLQLSDIEYFYESKNSGKRHYVSSTDIPETFETKLICKDGELIDVFVSAKDIVIRNKPYRVLIIRNITEKKQFDRKLVSLNSRMTALLDSATQVSIIAIDLEGLITVFNRGAELLLGYKQSEIILKKSITSIHLESELAKHQQRINIEFNINISRFSALIERVKRSNHESGVWHYLSDDGEEIPVQLTITSIRDNQEELQGYLCIAYDMRDKLSEEKRHFELEAQLQQSQKMETIGTLAGGIAHDLNNLLTPIVGYTEMVLEDLDDQAKEHRRLSRSLKAAIRARDLVKQILTFSHQVKHETRPIKTATIVKEVLELLSASLSPSIKLIENIIDKNSLITADATKIHQVLMNLCTNSAHAMGKDGGSLTIAVSQLVIKPDSDSPLNLPDGKYVNISVSDTGCGMTEGTKNRIFEPFFTTKDIGEGTGLGLSVAHGIIHSHEGIIIVNSELGIGTTFDIYLPYAQVTETISNLSKVNVIGKNSHVLYVDDEPAVAKLAQKMLTRKGFQTTSVMSSKEALELFTKFPNKYDILVSDQTMPDLTGIELAEKINKIKPDLPIILVTGLGSTLEKEPLKKYGVLDVISKPVLSADLTEAINNALGS